MKQPSNQAHQRAAAMTLLAATATSLFAAAVGDSTISTLAAIAYLGVVAGALRLAAWVTAAIVAGPVLAAVLLLAPAGPALLLLAPVVAGVIATSEFLAAAARLEAPASRAAPDEFRRPLLAALSGTGVFAIVLLASRLPGPAGLAAVVIAASACVGLAMVLDRSVRPTG